MSPPSGTSPTPSARGHVPSAPARPGEQARALGPRTQVSSMDKGARSSARRGRIARNPAAFRPWVDAASGPPALPGSSRHRVVVRAPALHRNAQKHQLATGAHAERLRSLERRALHRPLAASQSRSCSGRVTRKRCSLSSAWSNGCSFAMRDAFSHAAQQKAVGRGSLPHQLQSAVSASGGSRCVASLMRQSLLPMHNVVNTQHAERKNSSARRAFRPYWRE